MIWLSSLVGILARPAMDTRAAVAANSGCQRADSDIAGEPAATGTGFLLVARAHADCDALPGPALTPKRVNG